MCSPTTTFIFTSMSSYLPYDCRAEPASQAHWERLHDYITSVSQICKLECAWKGLRVTIVVLMRNSRRLAAVGGAGIAGRIDGSTRHRDLARWRDGKSVSPVLDLATMHNVPMLSLQL